MVNDVPPAACLMGPGEECEMRLRLSIVVMSSLEGFSSERTMADDNAIAQVGVSQPTSHQKIAQRRGRERRIMPGDHQGAHQRLFTAALPNIVAP